MKLQAKNGNENSRYYPVILFKLHILSLKYSKYLAVTTTVSLHRVLGRKQMFKQSIYFLSLEEINGWL